MDADLRSTILRYKVSYDTWWLWIDIVCKYKVFSESTLSHLINMVISLYTNTKECIEMKMINEAHQPSPQSSCMLS